MAGFEDECDVEVGELSRSVKEISNALVDLGMLPIQDIPQLLITAEEVLVASRGYADPQTPQACGRWSRVATGSLGMGDCIALQTGATWAG
jgi:hypothetical protein